MKAAFLGKQCRIQILLQYDSSNARLQSYSHLTDSYSSFRLVVKLIRLIKKKFTLCKRKPFLSLSSFFLFLSFFCLFFFFFFLESSAIFEKVSPISPHTHIEERPILQMDPSRTVAVNFGVESNSGRFLQRSSAKALFAPSSDRHLLITCLFNTTGHTAWTEKCESRTPDLFEAAVVWIAAPCPFNHHSIANKTDTKEARNRV